LIASIDQLGNRTSFTFDAASRQVRITNALGYISTTVFDNDDRVIAQINPLANRTSFAYDLASRQIRVTNALGNITTQRRSSRRDHQPACQPDQLEILIPFPRSTYHWGVGRRPL
jgi:YD repeat-containing protein